MPTHCCISIFSFHFLWVLYANVYFRGVWKANVKLWYFSPSGKNGLLITKEVKKTTYYVVLTEK